MMTYFICVKKGHNGNHCPNTQCFMTAQGKFLPQEHLITMIDHISTHIIITTAQTDYTPSITDTAKGITLTGQDHTINLNLWQNLQYLLETNIPQPAVAHDIHPQIDTIEDTPSGTLHIVTDEIHPWPNTLHTRATLTTTPLTIASLAQGTPVILPINHIWGGHWSHICKQQSPIDPRIRRWSLFRAYSQTLPQHWTTIQML